MAAEQISDQNVSSFEKKLTYEPSNNGFILIMIRFFKDSTAI